MPTGRLRRLCEIAPLPGAGASRKPA